MWTNISTTLAAVEATPSLSLVLQPLSQLTYHGHDVNCCFVVLVDQPKDTVDCSVADNDMNTVGKHPESLYRLNMNLFGDFTAGSLCPSKFSNMCGVA